jgi:KUP system potassium uptake protein
MLGALGVVFGDIGTSPLYAFEAVFSDPNTHVAVNQSNVLGILSLFVWALMLVVTVKYVLIVMRFDNAGEGGIVALMTLLLHKLGRQSHLRKWFLPLGLLGAALFYGDGVITPAISVVSAVEGLETISPEFQRYVVPVSLVILVGLFAVQSQGVGKISKFFGPVMLVWFTLLAVLGISNIAHTPEVLWALNPLQAIEFVSNHTAIGFFVLGAVVLCMTGAEALYADMGHFGAKPIQRAWIWLVFPALVLNYLGQGALVLQSPENVHNPFFRMAPDWALNALVVLATLATVIASQAVISGVFSVTQQLVQLRAIPRMIVRHTSDKNSGQIYVPAANWFLLVLVVLLVLMFQSSNAMAGAYGIAVTGTMVITDFFLIAVLVFVKQWKISAAVSSVAVFVVIDVLFFSSNLTKLGDGGWFPVLLSAIILFIIMTWQRGDMQIRSFEREHLFRLPVFLKQMDDMKPYRSQGTVVCLTSNVGIAPATLVLLAKRFHTIPENVICLHIDVEEMPYVSQADRVKVQPKVHNVDAVTFTYGYSDRIDIAKTLRQTYPDIDFDQNCTYLINRWSLWADDRKGWPLWRKKLFIRLFRNAASLALVFELPPQQVVEVGERLAL